MDGRYTVALVSGVSTVVFCGLSVAAALRDPILAERVPMMIFTGAMLLLMFGGLALNTWLSRRDGERHRDF